MGIELTAAATILRCDRCATHTTVHGDWLKAVIRLGWYPRDRNYENFALCPRCAKTRKPSRVDHVKLSAWIAMRGGMKCTKGLP